MKNMSTKEYVLSILERNKGDFVTGMRLAEDLGVSRNAIWKAVNELKKEGYDIRSVSNKGYSLDISSDILSVSSIREALSEHFTPDKAAIISESIIIFDSIDSTNKAAKLEYISGSMNKKIIIARKQTAGKGHGNKRFESPEGGIYMSIILDADNKSKLTLSAASLGEAVKNIIEKLSGKKTTLDIKTNSIYIGSKKVCGILTEYFADLETNTINGYVIGIGIRNINISKNKTIADILSAILL